MRSPPDRVSDEDALAGRVGRGASLGERGLELPILLRRFGARSEVVAEGKRRPPPLAPVGSDVERVPTRRPFAKYEPTVTPRKIVDFSPIQMSPSRRTGDFTMPWFLIGIVMSSYRWSKSHM